MNHRERILKAFEHKEMDSVPLDLSGHRSSGMHAGVYKRLRKCLDLPDKPLRIYDPVQQLAIVDEDLLDLFGVDTIELGRGFALEDSWWVDWTMPDGTPAQMPVWAKPEREGEEWVIRRNGRKIARMPDGALFFEQTYFPFEESEDLDKLAASMSEMMWGAMPSPPGPSATNPQALREGAKRFRQNTDRAVIGLFGGNLLENANFLYGMENFLYILAGEPERAHAFLDRLTELHLRNLETFLGAVGDCIDIIAFGDDLGMQSGPMISPAMYREFFKPRHAALWQKAKSLANVKVMLHSCGGIRELLPDLIDAGLDAVNPVQTTCSGMDAASLKKDFGRDIVFWGGGCDTRSILPKAKPEEVRRHVRQQIDIMRKDGGFVFQQVHNVMADVPVENIAAMLDEVKRARDSTLCVRNRMD